MFHTAAAAVVVGDAAVQNQPVNWPAVVAIVLAAAIQRYFDYRTERDRRTREADAEEARKQREYALAQTVAAQAKTVAAKVETAHSELKKDIQENTEMNRGALEVGNNFTAKIAMVEQFFAELKQLKAQSTAIDATTSDTNATLHAAVDTPKE